MLNFVVLALAFIGSQQVSAEPVANIGTFIPDVPNPTVPGYKPYNPDFIPGMPNPFSCPNFPIIPYHYNCYCDLSHCLDPYIEAAAEDLARNTRFLSLCDIQQLFALFESVVYGIDPATEVAIISEIVYALEAEIYMYNGNYNPISLPEYCDQYSTGLDPFMPSSMFASDYTMSYYNDRMAYMLDRTMPYLSTQLDTTLQQLIEMYLRGQYEYDESELYYKMCFCLRGILANMVNTTPTPYVY